MKIQILENPESVTVSTLPNEKKIIVAFFNEKEKQTDVLVKLFPGENSQLYFIAVCKVSGVGVLNLKTYQTHDAPGGWSDLLCKTVLTDQAKFEYRGFIEITKKGQKSHAYQRNENLVLSEEASVVSEPNLEILANDVFCTHGSTTGYIQDEQMFYLSSRGLTVAKIEEIFAEGFLYSAFDKVAQRGIELDEVNKFFKV